MHQLNRLSLILAALPLLMSAPRTSSAASPDATLPPRVRVPPTATAPVIDGIITPGEWDDAFMGAGIARHYGTGLDPIKVHYWFAYDRTNVYLAATMETPADRNLCVPGRRLAGNGNDTHFEFLIDPFAGDPDRNWVQTMVYPMGRVQNLGYSQRIGGFVPYDVPWTCRDGWKDGVWSVEMSAPADAFNRASLENGRVWGVLFAGRIMPELNYFSGQLGELFAMRSRYLKMVLDRDAPVVRIADMGDVASGAATPDIRIRNTTARPLALKVEFAVRPGLEAVQPASFAETRRLTVAPDAEGRVTVSVPLPTGAEPAWLAITVAPGDGGPALYEGLYKLTRPREPKWQSAAAPALPPVILEAYPYPSHHRVKAVVDFGGLPARAQAAEARFRVIDTHGAPVASTSTRAIANAAAEEVVQLPERLPAGRYAVRAELVDAAGRELASATDTFERVTFPFENNTLGVSDKVLYPWTPISVQCSGFRVQGKDLQAQPEPRTLNPEPSLPPSLSVWNRTHTLGAAALPSQIVSDGEAVLAGPIQLVETVDGRAAPLAGGVPAVTRAADHAVEIEAAASGRVARAGIRLHAEYDGMLKYEITIAGAKGARLDGLDLVIPFRADRARFLHAAGDGCRSNFSHELPGGEGRVWDSTAVMNWVMPVQWLTYLWLGDHRRGLCWWADSTEGWTLPRDKTTPVVEIRREGEVVNVVLHILSRPATVLWKDEVPRKLVFAFEATPMKPKPSWDRDIGLIDARVTRQKAPRFHWVGNTFWAFQEQEKQYDPASGNYTFAYLRPISPEAEAALKRMTDRDAAEGRTTLVYTDMRARALVGPPEKAYAWEWSPTTELLRKETVAKAPVHYAVPIAATRSRVDYDLWCLNRGMDLGIDAWYFDEIQNEGQINPVTGLGYQDEDGRWLPTMRLFQYRELWKRLYTLMQDRGQKEPVIVIHNTSTTYAGPMAFCTTTWDFEEANSDPHFRQLTKFGIDYLITEAMGHQYGFTASTLGPGGKFEAWIRNGDDDAERNAGRHWMGVHMVLAMNPYLSSHPQVAEGLRILGEFGWNAPDCTWTPWWDAEAAGLGACTPSDHVYSALYRRGNRALLVVLNDSPDARTLLWRPGPALTVQGDLADAENAMLRIAPTNGAFSIAVPAFDYRVMKMEARQ